MYFRCEGNSEDHYREVVVMSDWMLGPPVLMGDRVVYVGGDEPLQATVRWLGRIPDSFNNQLVAGISLVRSTPVLSISNSPTPGRTSDSRDH